MVISNPTTLNFVETDGANIAYFGNAEPRYSQVKLVVEELQRMGENPLVTMPSKYTTRSFRLVNERTKTLSDKELNVIER
jgi:hypothetical protein